MRSQFPPLCSASILNQRKPELAAVSAWLLQGSTDYISVSGISFSLIDIFMTLIYYDYSSFHITFHTLNIQYVTYLTGGLL